jgi:hypothetical protein
MAIYHIERAGITIFADLDEARPFMALARQMERAETWGQYCELVALREALIATAPGMHK